MENQTTKSNETEKNSNNKSVHPNENASSKIELGEKSKPHSLDFMYDVPMEMTIELGRTDVNLRNLLRLQVGSVIELDKLAGEPLEAYLRDRLVSRGEVVVVNEKYGIRLTDIVTHPDMKESNKN